jgi:hypothetical protein
MNSRILPRLLLGLVLAPLVAHAQTDIHFRLYGLGGTLPTPLTYKSGDKFVTLKVTKGYLSTGAYDYSGDPAMGLFTAGGASAAGASSSDSGPKMTQVGKIVFPGSGTYVVAILGQENGTVVGEALPDSLQDFPGGAVRVVNIAGVQITVAVNDQKFILNGGGYRIVPMGATPTVTIDVRTGPDSKEVANTMLNINTSVRTTLYLSLRNAPQIQANPSALPRIEITSSQDGTNTGPTGPKSSASASRNSSY